MKVEEVDMNLGDKVDVCLEITGELVGRTFESNPKVDLKLPWGVLNGIPLSVITRDKPAEKTEEKPANVTEIRPAVQRRRRAS